MHDITVLVGDLPLQTLNLFAHELDDLAGLKADHMVMVIAPFQFENGMATFEVVPDDESRRLKLREHPINSRQADLFMSVQQLAVDVLGREVLVGMRLKDFENLEAGKRDLEARIT